LKLDSGEFGSFVMKTDKGSWVATEPEAIKGISHALCGFLYPEQQSTQASWCSDQS
jgi:hypothetical protein